MKYFSINKIDGSVLTRTIFVLISCFIVVLFLNTGVSKLTHYRSSIVDMNNQPFPNSWTTFLVWTLSLAEIATGLSILFQRTRLAGLYGAVILMSCFTIYSALILSHVFQYVPCSCGGFVKGLNWQRHIALTLAVLLLSWWCIRALKGPLARSATI